MDRRRLATVVVAIALASAPASASAAVTIGTTTLPPGGHYSPCDPNRVYVTSTLSSPNPFVVPAGGGKLTAWQFNTTVSVSGTTPTFVVLRPTGTAGSFTVVGRDTEAFPTPLPSGHLVSFPIEPPIATQPGDEIGFYWPTGSGTCLFGSTSLVDTEVLTSDQSGSPPAVGDSVTTPNNTPPNYEDNLSATLDNDLDAGVSVGVTPASATVGSLALLGATVTNAGPASAPITFTENVPSGLTINSAVAGTGSCGLTGRTVSCTVTLPSGGSAPVDIVVTPTRTGAFADTASVTGGVFADPAPNNNAASAILRVVAGPAKRQCRFPSLARTPLSVAIQVLKALGCAVGKVTRVPSATIGRGLVIGTTPKPGSVRPAGTRVSIRVSSGRKRTRRSR